MGSPAAAASSSDRRFTRDPARRSPRRRPFGLAVDRDTIAALASLASLLAVFGLAAWNISRAGESVTQIASSAAAARRSATEAQRSAAAAATVAAEAGGALAGERW